MSRLTIAAAPAERFARSADDAAAAIGDLNQTNADAGDLVIGAARIPVKSGALKRTARYQVTPQGVTLLAGDQTVGYAAAVHARSPFYTDAIGATADRVTDHYADRLDDAVGLIRGN